MILHAGLQFESKLMEDLEALGLSFWTEEALRAKGYFKTPDAKLQVASLPVFIHCWVLHALLVAYDRM